MVKTHIPEIITEQKILYSMGTPGLPLRVKRADYDSSRDGEGVDSDLVLTA